MRIALTLPPARVRAYFGYADEPDFPPRASIAPSEPIAVVSAPPFARRLARRFHLVRWGFLPGFVKDPESFPLLASARAETLAQKPSFAAAFRRRRCLVPADGFYPRRTPGPLIRAADGGPLALAGLYETYLHVNGSEIDTACLVTTAANALVAQFAGRMPAIVPRAAFAAWLDCDTTALAAALALLRPADEALLQVA